MTNPPREFSIPLGTKLSGAFTETLMLSARVKAFQEVHEILRAHGLAGTAFSKAFLAHWDNALKKQTEAIDRFERLCK